MGNITTKSVGNFQANVGKVSGDIGVIVSYITAGILILTAIGLAIAAMIPMKPWDCTKEHLNELVQNAKTSCKPTSSPITGPGSQACAEATQDYRDEQKRCGTKVKQTWLLWFLLLIPLAVIIVVISRWWNHFMHTNKTAAQIGGTMFELNTLKDFMR